LDIEVSGTTKAFSDLEVKIDDGAVLFAGSPLTLEECDFFGDDFVCGESFLIWSSGRDAGSGENTASPPSEYAADELDLLVDFTVSAEIEKAGSSEASKSTRCTADSIDSSQHSSTLSGETSS
jgi:hypothetical protein